MIYSTFFVGNIRDISMSVSVCCICTDFLPGQADCCHPLVCLEWQGKYKHGSLLFLIGRSIMLWKGGIIMSKIQNRVNFNLPRWSFQHQCQPCCVFRSRLGWRRSYLVSFIITIKTMIWPPTKYLLPGTTCSCL